MEANKSTFERPTHEEVRKMFRRAKARQQQLEEEGRRMWEEEQESSGRFFDLMVRSVAKQSSDHFVNF